MSSIQDKDILVIEIPSEAGTHWYGQSLAPAALKSAGLQSKLETIGYKTRTVSALPGGPQVWKPSPKVNSVRDEEGTIYCMNQVKLTLMEYLHRQHDGSKTGDRLSAFPFVIGGPCTNTAAVLSALHHLPGSSAESTSSKKIGLLYIDNDADLTLPSETTDPSTTAILDSMTLSHMTHRPGSLESMKAFTDAQSAPPINPNNIALYGIDPTQPTPAHFCYLLDNHFRVLTNAVVSKSPIDAMRTAIGYLDSRCDEILLHLDVDVVDSAEWPLGNYPSYGGLSFDTVMSGIQYALTKCEKIIGMSVTEVNPNNDPDGRMVTQLVDGLVEGLAGRLRSLEDQKAKV